MTRDEETAWRIGVLYSRSGVTGATESEHFFGTVIDAHEAMEKLGLGKPDKR